MGSLGHRLLCTSASDHPLCHGDRHGGCTIRYTLPPCSLSQLRPEGIRMFRITIRCPATGDGAAMDIELAGGLISIPPYSTTVHCPSCGQSHEWRSVEITHDTPKTVSPYPTSAPSPTERGPGVLRAQRMRRAG